MQQSGNARLITVHCKLAPSIVRGIKKFHLYLYLKHFGHRPQASHSVVQPDKAVPFLVSGRIQRQVFFSDAIHLILINCQTCKYGNDLSSLSLKTKETQNTTL